MLPTSRKNCAKFLTFAIFENELGPSQRVFFGTIFQNIRQKSSEKKEKEEKKI
jgi:hypothetical protein